MTRALTPSASASLLLDLYQALQRFGLVGPADLQELGMTPAQLLDLERRVPVELLLRLWHKAASRGAPADLGLRVGKQLDLSVRGPVANLVALSANLGEALGLFCRYIAVMSECESLRVEPRGTAVRISYLFSEPLASHAMASERSLSAGLSWARQMTGVNIVPLAVGFRHTALAAPSAYRQVFGRAVRFGEVLDYLDLSHADLALPLLSGNAYLKTLLQQRVSSMHAQLPAQHSRRAQVVRLLEQGLVTGELSVAAVSRQLGVSRQTLHRHLRDEQCSFSELLAELRRRRALQRLPQADCRVEALSRELGFNEPSAFYKAFKTWFGLSPKAYQAQSVARAAPSRSLSA
jgi:AraC-like DNA-binding protein